MRSFFALALAGAASATVMEQNDFEFMNYVVKHSKAYSTVEEFNMRKANFKAIDEEIVAINNQNLTHTVGHNFLSDMTKAEKDKLLGLKNMPLPDLSNATRVGADENGLEAPTSVDWKAAGKCTAVKNQGSCGSCWSFAATAAMESAHAIFYSSLPTLSEQQLVSCSSAYGNGGCNGGWYFYAWDYAGVFPVTTASVYPYSSGST